MIWSAPVTINNGGLYSGETLTVDGRRYPTQYLMHPQPLEEEMTYEKLKKLIVDQGIDDIADLIKALPWQMRENNYVVMYRSRSLQHASITQPRILSYTPTARLILSFNSGDRIISGKSHKAYNAIEVIQFRDETSRFEFREIKFGPGGPTFSAANPSKCMTCHQSENRSGVDLRPNWEPYNIWPGAIGAKDGGIAPGPIQPDHRYRPYDKDFLAEQAQEESIIKTFQQVALRHPRYRHLGSLNLNGPVALSELLAILNFQRVIRLMKETGEHYKNSKESLALLGECSAFISGDMFEFYRKRSPANKYFSYSPVSLSDTLTFMFEGVGIDTTDWSMDFGTKGRFALFERFGTPSHNHHVFKYAWAVSHKGKPSEDCDSLKLKAESQWIVYKPTLSTFVPRRDLMEAGLTLPQIFSSCKNCHNSYDGIAPDIDFENRQWLTVALQQKSRTSHRTLADEILYRTSDMATNGEQMPPQKRLSARSRELIAEYIQSLTE